jgi:hypothetical protein
VCILPFMPPVRPSLVALVVGLNLSGCAHRVNQIPPQPQRQPTPRLSTEFQGRGPIGLDLPEDREVLDHIARSGCMLTPLTARLTLNGTVSGQRLETAIWIAVLRDSLRIESTSNRPFVLTSRDTRSEGATLRRKGEPLVRSADVPALVHATIGVPLTATDFHALLLTCPMGGVGYTLRTGPNRLDVETERRGGFDTLHLSRSGRRSPWRLQALTSTHKALSLRWRTELDAPFASAPKILRLTSIDWKGEPSTEFDLTATMDRVQISPAVDPFEDPAAADEETITLEALKATGTRMPLILP